MNIKLSAGAMQSDAGYTVNRLSRNQLVYQAGDKSVVIEVEPGGDLAVYLSVIKAWDTPAEVMSDQERGMAVKNIQEGLAFLGVKCSFG